MRPDPSPLTVAGGSWRGVPSPEPSQRIASADRTPIALFASGDGPPLLLVHGAAADHTTFRVIGPRLATSFTVQAMDRRGRGSSGDTAPYSIQREFEDIAAVAEALAAETGTPVAVLGHSYGGRCALGAALLTDRIASVICYEGAPAPPGATYEPDSIKARVRARLEAGDLAGLLANFMTDVVGMTPEELAHYRADPIWPVRVAAAGTIPRELDAETDPAATLDRLGAVRQPVLQVLGSDSRSIFREATLALDERLANGRVVEIAGAKHAAHHTHPDAMIEAVRDFIG